MRDYGLEAEILEEIADGLSSTDQTHLSEGKETLTPYKQILLEPEILQAVLEVLYNREQEGL